MDKSKNIDIVNKSAFQVVKKDLIKKMAGTKNDADLALAFGEEEDLLTFLKQDDNPKIIKKAVQEDKLSNSINIILEGSESFSQFIILSLFVTRVFDGKLNIDKLYELIS